MKKGLLLASVLAGSTVFTQASIAESSLSANLGYMSDYFYRGVFQADGVANGGIDYENGGFYVGTWAADVDDGLEVDVYGGYSHEFDGGFTLGAGLTGYFYTGDFDDTYKEVNLSAGWGAFSLGYSIGEYDNFAGPKLDYDFINLTAEHNGFYATYGSFGQDFDGDYFEFGYGTEVAGFDLSGAIIINSEELDAQTGEGEESFVLSLSRSFDLN